MVRLASNYCPVLPSAPRQVMYVGGLRVVRFLYVGGLVTVLCRRAGGFSDNNAMVAKYNIKLMDVRVDGCDISMLRGLAVVTADG